MWVLWLRNWKFILFCASTKLLQSCPTLCNPMEHSLPGSSVHGILQARVLEWVAVSFFRGSSWPRDGTCVSYISYIGRQVFFLPLAPPGKPINSNLNSCGRPEASVLDSVAVEGSRRGSELETPCAVVDGVASWKQGDEVKAYIWKTKMFCPTFFPPASFPVQIPAYWHGGYELSRSVVSDSLQPHGL